MASLLESLQKDTPLRRALFISLLYAVFAVIWIVFSDRVLVALIDDPVKMGLAQTLKGSAFVIVTAVLLFALIFRATSELLEGYRLAANANRDQLTGLPGLGAARALAGDALERAAGKNLSLAFVVLDVERMARINDALGVGAGNAFLIEVARRLERFRRADWVLARPGSDKFFLISMSLCSREDAEQILGALLANLDQAYTLANESLEVRLNAGIAMFPEDGRTFDELVHAADQALLDARQRHQRYRFFRPSSQDAHYSLNIESALSRALDKGQFRAYFQPLVDLRSGHITGAEALLRWQHPEMGLMLPNTFIPLLEQRGAIHEVGQWMLQRAVSVMHKWPQQDGQDIRVGVNVSRVQLETASFEALARKVLNGSDVRSRRVVLEITESMAMQQPEVILERVKALRTMGFAMAMDDFGTGHSSLAYLKRFPFDFIKIDRAFVHGIPDDAENDVLVEIMRNMSAHFGRGVIAEGVETTAEAQRLYELGFETAQGFLFSRPLPEAEFQVLLEREPCYLEVITPRT